MPFPASFFFGLAGSWFSPVDAKPLTSEKSSVSDKIITSINPDSVLVRFPDDDLYTRHKPESETGLVVDFRKSRFSNKISLEGLDIKNTNGRDGFSPAGPVLFEVAAHPDKGSLPARGGGGRANPVKIYNMATGEEVKTSVTSVQAADDVSILYIYPERKFASGRHVALITKDLKSGGVPVKTSPFMDVNSNRSDVVAFLSERGIPVDNLIDLKTFTVASKDAYLQPVNSIVNKIQSSVPTFCGGSNESEMLAEIATMHTEKSLRYHKATGKLAFRKFFNKKNGWLISEHKTRCNCVQFSVFYPRFYKESGPVLLFGHPLNGSIDNSMKYIYPALKKGYAVIGIDLPYHGNRGSLSINLKSILYLFNQGAADMLSLSHALGTTLSSLDLFPENGKADFDQQRVSYLGISLGAIVGQLAVARGNVKSAYFKTGGVNIGQMFTLGADLGFFRRLIVPEAFNKPKEAIFLAMMQDGFVLDGIHYMDNITPHSQGPKRIGFEIMHNDDVIDSRSALALKRLLKKNPATTVELETYPFRNLKSHAEATASMKFYPAWLMKQSTR
ncbi:alpha/beta hydrolase family protein [Endozoicomonas lisbonensis]|uniref:alpha/beta hydrolase family protein n=1 Tax=Endozoicomonas lisbonensis TaxID=3120522 RepID=UPI0033931916